MLLNPLKEDYSDLDPQSREIMKKTINYLISIGADTKRILGKGFGETQLVNKCSNGVDCTEIEHQQNRRTEFVVIKK